MKSQRIRFQRMMWGFASLGCTLTIVLGLYLFGMLPAYPTIIYTIVVTLMAASFVVLNKSGLNLRFKDPSMTVAQITTPLWPAIYIMYFVSDAQARTAFLLMATGGLLFGMFALPRRTMLAVGLLIFTAYLVLLCALTTWSPERVNWQVEVVIVFAYFAVLMIVAYLGSVIAGMRTTLKKQNHKLEILASRDSLTQLPNRRSLMDQLAQESARLERRTPEQSELCISMLDIDHFKKINDTWGHDAGDAVLVKISQMLQKIMRQGDFVGRFGGEEFIIILPESTLPAATLVAERIQSCVSGLTFPELPEGTVITVSQGLCMHHTGDSIEATLKRADEALYQAKAHGRNKVVVS
ncbi:MAG: GGDEF domain-containing protein [Pseudohongiella sp.]|nr:GGDEF domain-containing protein [Pseudohongiella sp.]MDP2127119.1 GGDEF domain-containing protein [Pseudohongiella sp.]